MSTLHFMEALRTDKLPRAEDVYLMRPDGPDVIETKREIEEKKGFWVHEINSLSYQRCTAN